VTSRAPGWMQRVGLEWLHRALSEPRRLVGRYARALRVFFPAVAAQAWRGRARRAAVAPGFDAAVDPPRVDVVAPMPRVTPEPALVEALSTGGEVVVDVRDERALDNRTIAGLVRLARLGRRHRTLVTLRGAARVPVAMTAPGRMRAPAPGDGQ
jgi:hypothetical protein